MKSPRPTDGLTLSRDGLTLPGARPTRVLGRLRATVKAERGERFHVDTLDLYSSRSRAEFARRAARPSASNRRAVEADLLALLVEAEKAAEADETPRARPPAPPP